jgi:hypothetical protein
MTPKEKANELRLGNLLQIDHLQGAILTLKERTCEIISGNVVINCEYDDIVPIPLTEEWLLNFGFGIKEDGNFWNEYLCIHNYDNELYLNFNKRKIWINYVHELQNLNFSLTGTELTTKNK